MVKFITTDIDHFGKKRKDTARACDRCRKRKKRCRHNNTNTSERGSSNPDTEPAVLTSTSITKDGTLSAPQNIEFLGLAETGAALAPPSILDDVTDLRKAEANRSETHPQPLESRFIGYLNPEGIVRAVNLQCPASGVSSAGKVGIWHSEKPDESGRQVAYLMTPSPSSLFESFSANARNAILPILKEECLSILPPSKHCEALCGIYFEKLHALFPIVNYAAYQRLPDQSPSRILLEQAMCLAASHDPSSRPHLVMVENEHPISLKEFGKRMFSAMRITVELGLVTNRIILIQVLALMSFFANGSEDSETSALIVGRAVHYTHSLGLHMQDRDGEPDRDYAEIIFCCVWTIDRINAALNGRPVLMHEQDIGRSLQKCFASQVPAFKLLLHVVDLLDHVIRLYHPPNTETDLHRDFILFEDLIIKCEACELPIYMLTAVEILYYAVAILSCRSRPGDSSSLGTTTSRTRQILSAERITALVSHEFLDRVVLFPFIPYAISLSLSVAYREMRQTKVPMYRARARTSMEVNCRLLEGLGTIFWPASVMAKLGDMILKELSRVYSNMTDAEPYKSRQKQSNLCSTVDSLKCTDSTSRQYRDDEQNLHSVDEPSPFYFNEMPNFDPFEMFDPNFDLDGVDTYLDGHLDFTFPLHRH